jgi:hypothetical protein
MAHFANGKGLRKQRDGLRLHLFEGRLVNSYAPVVIPFDESVIFIDLPNRAKFSSRHSEITQTFDAISGTQISARTGRVDKRWLPRTV